MKTCHLLPLAMPLVAQVASGGSYSFKEIKAYSSRIARVVNESKCFNRGGAEKVTSTSRIRFNRGVLEQGICPCCV